MTWIEIANNNLKAAQRMLEFEPRSCQSRAYYAAHHALTARLLEAGYSIEKGMNTPPHKKQAELISQYFASAGFAKVKELKSSIRRLYRKRLEADYMRGLTVDRSTGMESLRDASVVFRHLAV
jgi:uncharacterized protein (UPF0332 family)